MHFFSIDREAILICRLHFELGAQLSRGACRADYATDNVRLWIRRFVAGDGEQALAELVGGLPEGNK